MVELLLGVANLGRGLVQAWRRVRVRVHRALFVGGNVPHYFVKVTNRSSKHDVEITHVWFEGNPRVDVLLPERPLPPRLKPDEQWECWCPAASLGTSRTRSEQPACS